MLKFLLPTLLFFSCTWQHTKLILKEITNDDITVRWYFYSYLTDTSPDIVEVEKKGVIKEIYRAEQVIVDIDLKKDSIFLKLFRPKAEYVNTKEVEKKIFNYHLVLDSTGISQDLGRRPIPRRQSIF